MANVQLGCHSLFFSFCPRKNSTQEIFYVVYFPGTHPTQTATILIYNYLFARDFKSENWMSSTEMSPTRASLAAESAAEFPLKPVLNWANVRSPNILRTVRRNMIRFLIELLVRRTWFGQSRLYFVLKWLVMKCKLWPELAADEQQTA